MIRRLGALLLIGGGLWIGAAPLFAQEAEPAPTPVPEAAVESDLRRVAAAAVRALAARDGAALARLAHPEKGVCFHLDVSMSPPEAVRFSPAALRGFFSDRKVYRWGERDGSGDPVRLRPRAYYHRYIYGRDFARRGKVSINPIGAGNSISRLPEFYPNAHRVGYYVKSTEGNTDWQQLIFVLEQDRGGRWRLVAIAHDEWTI